MAEQEKAKDINNMTPRELKIEIDRLKQCLEMRDSEISRLKGIVENMAALEADKEDVLEMKKQANQALNSAFEQADAIIMQARRVADRIIERAKEIAHGGGEAELVLPGSKDLVISDDLLKMGGLEEERISDNFADSIINECFGKKNSQDIEEDVPKASVNKRSWMDILDELHR